MSSDGGIDLNDDDIALELGHGVAQAIIEHYEDRYKDKVEVKITVYIDEDIKDKVSKLIQFIWWGVGVVITSMVVAVVSVWWLFGGMIG